MVIEEHSSESSLVNLILAVQQLLSDMSTAKDFSELYHYSQQLTTHGSCGPTLHSMTVFVMLITLFIYIRTSNWDLRMASLKSMAPFFSAYDRPCYQKLVPRHIAVVLQYPKEVIHCLKAGGSQ